MKRKYLTFFITIIAIAAVFFIAYRLSKKEEAATEEPPNQPIEVSVQSVSASVSLLQPVEYPATVVGEQEIKVTAKSAGNAKTVNFDLGDKVSAGVTLVKIDDTGNNLGIGEGGFRSADVQQAELSVEQAEEQLEVYKKTYKKLFNAYEAQKKNPDLTKTVTKAQVIAAKGNVEIAEVQLENAKVGLRGGLDDHLITSPISGFITSKSISEGDSIALGQELYTISKTSNLKIQFFVDQEQLEDVNEDMKVSVKTNSGNKFSATIRNISPVADESTKRFLIEAIPEETETKLTSGTIVTVSFSINVEPREKGNLILPLSAITIGQNENYIFVMEGNKAKKTIVQIINIDGRRAEIKADLPGNAMIIVSGNKLINDGEEINIKN